MVRTCGRALAGPGVGAFVLAGILMVAGCGSDVHALPAAATSRASTSSAPTASAAAHHGLYVALGDSYTAAPGVPDQNGDPSGCKRSSDNYPALVAAALGLTATQLIDVSCSGATIADLTADQDTGDGVNPAQLDALSADDAIVTVGISGNDVDFSGVLTRCVELDVVPALMGSAASGTSPCEAYYTSGGANQIDKKIQDASTRLASALKQVERRAPHARIYVVGYPDLLPSGGDTCAHTIGITPGDLTFLNDEELGLNSMLEKQAGAVGADYVDTYTPSKGHDACSSADTRWIEPLIPTSDAAPLHPNIRGERAMADAALAAINGSR